MDTIKRLSKLINEHGSLKYIHELEETLGDSIEEVVDIPAFYEIPTNNLLRIIRKSQIDDIEITKKLVYNFSEHKGEEAPLILNVIDPDEEELREYLDILSNMPTCPIFKHIKDISSRNKNLPRDNFRKKYNAMKQENAELKKENADLKASNDALRNEITRLKNSSRSFNSSSGPNYYHRNSIENIIASELTQGFY